MPSVRDLETNDPNVLLKRITEEFPEVNWSAYEFINHGWDHEVIILDDKLVFRFPASSEYLPGLEDEVRLLDHLSSKIDFRIPRYKYVARDRSFAGYGIIPGIELTEEAFAELSDEDRAILAAQLAKFLTGLHTVTVNELQQFNVSHVDLKAEAQKLRAQAKQYLRPVLTEQEHQHALNVLSDFDALLGSDYPLALTHNDISPKHIIWNQATKQVGIIDFSDRAISDPAFDFTELFLYGRSFTETVYEAYAGPKDDNFLDRATIYLKRIGVYMLIDSFLTDRISYKEAKALFDKVIKL